jgi:twitching motility protein PilT
MAIHIDRLLETCIKRGASDLHLHVGRPPILRLHGRLRQLETKVLEPPDTVELMRAITPERCQAELQQVGTTDFGFAFGDQGRFRVSIFRQKGYTGLVLRLIPQRIMTLEQIGLPKMVSKLCARPRGLVLVTGPTGSGKTTTLAAMVNYINEIYDKHIITIEDPIEYYHTHKKSMVNQREVGVDVPDFKEALRRALRQNPDVILVGEMRDLATMEAAVAAAETGHLVFATLHTNSAEGTVNRIIDQFPGDQQNQIRVQLSVALIGVISQTLCPRVDQPGVIAAYEFMVVTPAIANLIRENKVFNINSAIQTGAKFGMILLDDYLWELQQKGIISTEEMLLKCRRPADVREKMRRSGVKEASQASIEGEDAN